MRRWLYPKGDNREPEETREGLTTTLLHLLSPCVPSAGSLRRPIALAANVVSTKAERS
jgi:hypothetical protein